MCRDDCREAGQSGARWTPVGRPATHKLRQALRTVGPPRTQWGKIGKPVSGVELALELVPYFQYKVGASKEVSPGRQQRGGPDSRLARRAHRLLSCAGRAAAGRVASSQMAFAAIVVTLRSASVASVWCGTYGREQGGRKA